MNGNELLISLYFSVQMPDHDHYAYALQLDQIDSLSEWKSKYIFPKDEAGDPCIYFCGNSLGLQPAQTRNDVNLELDRWAEYGVKGHFEGDVPWYTYQDDLVEQLTRIVGGLPGEVTIMNTLTVNIHLMLVSFYKPTPGRYKILVEYSPFPSDLYAVKSQIRWHGYEVEDALIELKPRPGEYTVRIEDINEVIHQQGEQLALVYFGTVNYLNGQVYALDSVIRQTHSIGAYFGLDLAHGAGNLVLELNKSEVDFAIWCNYKYLNGGPNSLAGCFIHQKHHQNKSLKHFEGWWGHDKVRRFLMEPEFQAMAGVEAWQLSGPPILSLAAMRAALNDFSKAGMVNLRNKSILLTGFLETLIESIEDPRIKIITPGDPAQRGCQLSILIQPPNKNIFLKLIKAGIVVDWREPGIIRIAPVPMYNSFLEIYQFYQRFQQILKSI